MNNKLIATSPGLRLHFRAPEEWSQLFLHYWGTQPDGLFTQWPGVPLHADQAGWYHMVLPKQYGAGLVINNGQGAQSLDLFRNRSGWWDQGWWDYNPEVLTRFTYPEGRRKALVMSYDDAGIQDRQLVEIFNRHGIKGTFHLNSDRLTDGLGWYLSRAEVPSLYQGHEVSAHTIGHPSLNGQSDDFIKYHVGQDRFDLEQLVGREVAGMSYPLGDYNDRVLQLLPELGIEYARTVNDTYAFDLPSNFLTWHPTLFHKHPDLMALANQYLQSSPEKLTAFFVWGHSYELDEGSWWARMNDICRALGGKSDIWYTGALDIRRYLEAIDNVFFLPGRIVNPSHTLSVWVKVGLQSHELPPGGIFPL